MALENIDTIIRTVKMRFNVSSKKRVGKQTIGNRLDDIALRSCDNWTKMLTIKDLMGLKNIF